MSKNGKNEKYRGHIQGKSIQQNEGLNLIKALHHGENSRYRVIKVKQNEINKNKSKQNEIYSIIQNMLKYI